jgi:hypothetical protein
VPQISGSWAGVQLSDSQPDVPLWFPEMPSATQNKVVLMIETPSPIQTAKDHEKNNNGRKMERMAGASC